MSNNENQENPTFDYQQILYTDEDLKSAFKEIWTKPKLTIRKIVNTNPRYLVIWLVILSGLSHGLSNAAGKSYEDVTLFTILLPAVVSGIIGGIIAFYIFGAVLKWVGSWFGGQASYVETQSAIAWSGVPSVAALALLIPEIFIFGVELYAEAPAFLFENVVLTVLYFLFAIIQLVLGVWAIVLFFATLSEVHRFGIGKSIATGILSFTLLILPIVILAVMAISLAAIAFP